MRGRRSILLLAFTLMLVPNLAQAEDSCPVTTPPNPPFVPSEPYSPNASCVSSPQTFWYGTNALWTSLPTEGVWRLPRQDNEGYVNKLFLWQEGYDWRKEPRPDIIVILRRLDLYTPSIVLRGGTSTFFGSFLSNVSWNPLSHRRLLGGYELT